MEAKRYKDIPSNEWICEACYTMRLVSVECVSTYPLFAMVVSVILLDRILSGRWLRGNTTLLDEYDNNNMLHM